MCWFEVASIDARMGNVLSAVEARRLGSEGVRPCLADESVVVRDKGRQFPKFSHRKVASVARQDAATICRQPELCGMFRRPTNGDVDMDGLI